MEYPVRIEETFSMTIAVEANSMEQAKAMVEKGYHDKIYVLGAANLQRLAITTLYPRNRDHER